jgi:hypothetical protein
MATPTFKGPEAPAPAPDAEEPTTGDETHVGREKASTPADKREIEQSVWNLIVI